MKIVQGNASWIEKCLTIGRGLPEFFSEQGLQDMEQDLKVNGHVVFVALKAEEVTGFISLHQESSLVGEISWLGVDNKQHGQGIGTQLVAEGVRYLQEKGVKLLKVKTLAEKADYPPYEKTRVFYEKVGFFLFETIDNYENWGPENPCAIYVKML